MQPCQPRHDPAQRGYDNETVAQVALAWLLAQHIEVAKAVVDDLADVLGAAVEPELVGEAELRRDHDLVAEASDRFAEDFLVLPPALALFDENGFEETTVEDIATAVGISSRSFFRYFPVKEDVVLGDAMPIGDVVRDALATRPVRASPVSATSLCSCCLVRCRRSPSTVVMATVAPPAGVLIDPGSS
jgi:Bacterial regulatory proteins, tetR family